MSGGFFMPSVDAGEPPSEAWRASIGGGWLARTARTLPFGRRIATLAHIKIGCICLPSSARHTVSPIFVKSATAEKGL